MIRRATLLLVPVVLAAALLGVAVHDAEGPRRSQGRIVVDGRAVVASRDHATRAVEDEAMVHFGDTVLVEAGTVILELADGARYELRHRDGIGARLEVGSPPTLLAGDALVLDGFPAAIQVGTATLRARGPMKAAVEDLVVEVYSGGAGVAGVGHVTDLAAVRRLALVSGARAEPIVFDGTDPWDRRYLGEAIAFGEQLEAIARGYTRGLPRGGRRTEDFFRSVLPALADEREFGADLLDPARPPGETLVGAAIAVQGRRGTFRQRWAEVFSFRAAGAAWGLVALDQGVSSAPVLETIELALGASEPSAPPTSASATLTTPTTATSTTTSTSAPDAPTTTTSPPEPAPPERAPPEPAPGLLDVVTDPVATLLDGLLVQR